MFKTQKKADTPIFRKVELKDGSEAGFFSNNKTPQIGDKLIPIGDVPPYNGQAVLTNGAVLSLDPEFVVTNAEDGEGDGEGDGPTRAEFDALADRVTALESTGEGDTDGDGDMQASDTAAVADLSNRLKTMEDQMGVMGKVVSGGSFKPPQSNDKNMPSTDGDGTNSHLNAMVGGFNLTDDNDNNNT